MRGVDGLGVEAADWFMQTGVTDGARLPSDIGGRRTRGCKDRLLRAGFAMDPLNHHQVIGSTARRTRNSSKF